MAQKFLPLQEMGRIIGSVWGSGAGILRPVGLIGLGSQLDCRGGWRRGGGSGENALDMHVEQQIQHNGDGQQTDGDDGDNIDLAADGLQIFE